MKKVNVDKFLDAFHEAVKILIPTIFFVVTCWPVLYPLAGVMCVAVLFDYGVDIFYGRDES